jgi:hypothetical protein
MAFFIHLRTRLALTPCSRASRETETPGSKHAATS